ncbi:beta-lactamase [Oleiphilus messinensis]|uniref:Beta-lactamase n=1 Tax=Oleiphilus messinensis TaxID=141451 RepID=A0A1Y0I4R7_9GAMM|nr:MBL fold metallo-hydrolase [Oleiphilus messinensis]ARU55478.1 beta-lactamase [Oleiphilus messinensis]
MDNVQVIPIPIWPFGMINAHLVVGAAGLILVDAGLPGTEAKVERVLRRIGRCYSDIKLIVITHAHIDHAGNAARLKVLTDAPIVAHKGDLAYFTGEKPMTFCATGWFGRLFFRTGAIQRAYDPFIPDILLDAKADYPLIGFGIPGSLIPTPGHTEGSISLLLESKQALVGDLVSSGVLLGGICLTHKAKRPPFEDDPARVANHLETFVQNGATEFYMGHGGPLPHQEVERHVRALRKLA